MITQDRTPWTPERLREAREAAYAAGVGTHLPLLAGVIARARVGGVWEIGVGHASSPLIAGICEGMYRPHFAWDSDQYWLDTTADLGARPVRPNAPAVAFIDCIGTERLRWVKELRDLCEFIVIHDTDNQGGDLNELLVYLDTFTYRYDYKVMRPWTTVVSMTRAYP